MSDSSIRCLICIPYIKEEVLVEIPKQCLFKELAESLKSYYSLPILPRYFYHLFEERFLSNEKTLLEENLEDGSILYWI